MTTESTNILTVYSKDNCPACVKLKARLQAEGREFIEVNVSRDSAARDSLIALGHRSVPVVYQDGKHVIL